MTQHESHPDLGDQYSIWSDDWFKLKRENWFAMELAHEFKDCSGKVVEPIKTSPQSWFHGTCWGNAGLIIKEGFIVGEGTHKKNSRSVQGLWCTSSVGNSACRCQPARYLASLRLSDDDDLRNPNP